MKIFFFMLQDFLTSYTCFGWLTRTTSCFLSFSIFFPQLTSFLVLRPQPYILRAGLHYGGGGLRSVKNAWPRHGKWWMCRRRIKGNKIFLLSWASPASWGWTRNSSSGEAQLQKVPPRRRPCHFIIHEKSSPPLFSSPSVNINRSRVAFSTNHNWETPFFSWPVDVSTVV